MQLLGPAAVVATNVEEMNTFYSRWKGLRGRDHIGSDVAFVFEPCRQVHTFGLRFPIDVVFLDERRTVVHVQTLGRRRVSRFVSKARSCVEIAGGRAAACGIEPGVVLEFVS